MERRATRGAGRGIGPYAAPLELWRRRPRRGGDRGDLAEDDLPLWLVRVEELALALLVVGAARVPHGTRLRVALCGVLAAQNALEAEELTGHRLTSAAVVAAVGRSGAQSHELFGLADLGLCHRTLALGLLARLCGQAGSPLFGSLRRTDRLFLHHHDVAPHEAGLLCEEEGEEVCRDHAVTRAGAAAALLESMVPGKRRHRAPALHPDPLAVVALPELALVAHPGRARAAGPGRGRVLFSRRGVGPEPLARDLLFQPEEIHAAEGPGRGRGRGVAAGGGGAADGIFVVAVQNAPKIALCDLGGHGA